MICKTMIEWKHCLYEKEGRLTQHNFCLSVQVIKFTVHFNYKVVRNEVLRKTASSLVLKPTISDYGFTNSSVY